MKRIIKLIIIFLFSVSVYSCTHYTGITYSKEENVYYRTEYNGKLYKCKMINNKLYCIEIKLEDTD